MKSISVVGLVLASVLVPVLACGPAPDAVTPSPAGTASAAPSAAPAKPVQYAETPDAPFRTTPPPEDGELTVVPPKIESFKLGSGMRVLLVERHDLPLVSVNVVIKGGAAEYPIAPGVASFMGSMLELGTATRDAAQISDDYQEIGAGHGAGVSTDAATASTASLAKHVERALTILSDVVQHPAFPEAELERQKAKRISSIQLEKGSAEAAAQNAIAPVLYGRAHPYGNDLKGRVEEVKKITRDDLVKAYGMVFNPKNATIVVVGDATRATISPKLEKAFGGWRAGKTALAPKPPGPPAPTPQRLFWVDRPGAPQSQVYVADVGPSDSTPDRVPLLVMNSILGGSFSSRINLNLREAHAYTYGARSRFALRHGPGFFSTGGAMVAQHTAASAQEILKEINRMIAEDVKPTELSEAKEGVRRGVATPFETLAGTASALEGLVINDRPLDYYATLPKKIDAVTIEDVRKAAKAYLHTDTVKVIVVGDRSKYQQAVVDGLKIGNPALLDEWGDPITK